ncbi:MAG: hypothetical protein ACXW2E_01640 [Nitrososphaeraceae archaeon]
MIYRASVPTFTWSSKPLPTNFQGLAFISNIGPNGSMWFSTGTKWILAHGDTVQIGYGTCPIGLPSSGSIGNNGALSGLTALNSTYSQGIYLYFPANAIVAGSAAGLYYTVMSSTTAGTIYNNVYTTGNPTIPSSPTAFSTTGPGAYTQTTATDITLASIPVIGGTMGINGQLFAEVLFDYKNSANNKLMKVKLGSTSFMAPSALTTTNTLRINGRIHNSNSTALQLFAAAGSIPANAPTVNAASSGWTSSTEVTSVDINVVVTGQLANAADHIILPAFNIGLLPS